MGYFLLALLFLASILFLTAVFLSRSNPSRSKEFTAYAFAILSMAGLLVSMPVEARNVINTSWFFLLLSAIFYIWSCLTRKV